MSDLQKVTKADAIEAALISGDLARLTVEERLNYYNRTCESLGLNPLTQPFAYINLNGKLQLYAKRDCAEQLRKVNGVSIDKMDKEKHDDLFIVTVYGHDKTGRNDTGTGAVSIANLKGENLANAIMKAETKAKRRFTLSICGLGMLDETEVASIPGAHEADAQQWGPEERQEYLDNKMKQLEAPAEQPELDRWNTLFKACVTADDFTAVVTQVKEEKPAVKMALMAVAAEKGFKFDRTSREFVSVNPPSAPPTQTEQDSGAPEPAPQNPTNPPAFGAETSTSAGRSSASAKTVSEKQVKRLWAIANAHNVNKETLTELLGQFGFEHVDELTTKAYNEICMMLEQYA